MQNFCAEILRETSRRRWEHNIKVDLRKLRCQDERWIVLPQDRVQRKVKLSLCFFLN
jgi:hypothetical protein